MMNKCLLKGSSFLILLLLVGVLAALAPLSSAFAQTTGRIYGQLLDGSNKNAPLAGQTVTLQKAQNGSSQDVTTAITDPNGRFSFSGLDTDKAISYAVYIRYQNAHYYTEPVSLGTKPEQQVNLTVYEASSDASKVAIVQTTLLVKSVDEKTGMVRVSEIVAFKNLNTKAFVGSLDASKGRPNALFFSLPQGATNISLVKGFAGYRSIQSDQGFATDAAVLPGDNEFSLSYDVPYTGDTLDLTYHAIYPTVQVSFMVPTDLHTTAGSQDVASDGVVTVEEHPYNVFKAQALTKEKSVKVRLEGLPVVNTQAPSTASQNAQGTQLDSSTIWLIVIIALMLVIILLTWIVYRSRREAARKATRNADKKAASQKRQEKQPEDDEREQELLTALLKLDREFEKGKLKKKQYEEQRARLKAQLRSLLDKKTEGARR
ncbi:carboxypeptidase-like regulatory domain-containing protein [Thermosporothrix hazakensis]|jgi:5-hydroxyisourate hydrolase-like protein (transthyretin family)|nr:carboxypeptidase-like regulatory domain-containing protein [Thermosporothrix hazakensis]BBH90434.1 hypothetical protein KTC_51850 [Thermosporothrix sp. COM3]GCE48471.1 hypothetical protein KTH_33400 [Thermosporothrix hazakensis]